MTPPHNTGDEQMALGAMMVDKEAAEKGVSVLVQDDFYDLTHGVIFGVIGEMVKKGKTPDMITVGSELARQSKLVEIGGAEVLSSMVNGITTSLHADHFFEQIKNYAILRSAIKKFSEVVNDCYEHQDSPQEVLEKAEKYLYSLTTWKSAVGLRHVKESIHEHLEALENVKRMGNKFVGIETGLPTLDRITSGLHRQNLVVLAARPSVGKTAMAVDFVRQALSNGIPTAFFSIEQSQSEIMNRFLSGMAKIKLTDLMHGTYTNEVYSRLHSAGEKIYNSPLYLVTSECHNISMLRAMCRKLATKLALSKEKLGLVVVDYLQLLGGETKNFENRQNEVSEISRNLKRIAKDMDVCVVALSQLNRKPEDRAGGRPVLSDLRESGSIEQDADLVLMMWRDDKCTQIEIQKHRNGPLGKISLFFQKEYASFVEMEGENN